MVAHACNPSTLGGKGSEFILVSGMEEAVLVYMEAIKNLLAI